MANNHKLSDIIGDMSIIKPKLDLDKLTSYSIVNSTRFNDYNVKPEVSNRPAER